MQDSLSNWISPLIVAEVNYVGNQQRLGQFSSNNFPKDKNINQGWRFKADSFNRQPFKHYTQTHPQRVKETKLEDFFSLDVGFYGQQEKH